ncbi:MAG: tetratricopeptide repeat protein [Gemmatimonadaceae bacterium]
MRLLVAVLLSAATAARIDAQAVEYRSKAGVEFRAPADTGAIARAREALTAEPRNVDRIIELGLAQSAVRQYHDAIATFTRGMKIEPKNPLLYRWRGHRYISIGAFDKALVDLTRGNKLDTTNYDILYHLGVAHFERGEFADAAKAFAQAQRRAPNDNELAGSTDWLWMSLARAKRSADAQKALAPINDTLKITSATAYAQRLKLYRGVIGPDQVIGPSDTAAVQVATMSFGVGNWYLAKGDTANARKWFKRAVDSGGWPGFAFFAAETELKRLR